MSNKNAEFRGKYTNSISHKLSGTDKQEVVSKCFQVTAITLAALRSYDSCSKAPHQEIPNAIGECVRKDGGLAVFFETKENCQDALIDAQSGASS